MPGPPIGRGYGGRFQGRPKAAPIARPSTDYEQKLLLREYGGEEKRRRNELRELEMARRAASRAAGTEADLGRSGEYWKQVAHAKSRAPAYDLARVPAGRAAVPCGAGCDSSAWMSWHPTYQAPLSGGASSSRSAWRPVVRAAVPEGVVEGSTVGVVAGRGVEGDTAGAATDPWTTSSQDVGPAGSQEQWNLNGYTGGPAAGNFNCDENMWFFSDPSCQTWYKTLGAVPLHMQGPAVGNFSCGGNVWFYANGGHPSCQSWCGAVGASVASSEDGSGYGRPASSVLARSYTAEDKARRAALRRQEAEERKREKDHANSSGTQLNGAGGAGTELNGAGGTELNGAGKEPAPSMPTRPQPGRLSLLLAGRSYDDEQLAAFGRRCKEQLAQAEVVWPDKLVIDLRYNRITDQGLATFLALLRELGAHPEELLLTGNPLQDPVALVDFLDHERGPQGKFWHLGLSAGQITQECLWRILEACGENARRPPLRFGFLDGKLGDLRSVFAIAEREEYGLRIDWLGLGKERAASGVARPDMDADVELVSTVESHVPSRKVAFAFQ